MTPTEAYAATLAEVRRCENRAVDSNKPTMWSYFWAIAEELGAWSGEDDAAIERRCRAAVIEAGRLAPHAPPHLAAHAWALSVYAARILRLSGHGIPKRSLDWLRARRRWPSRREKERAA